jgi:hypothetical protein
MNPEKDSPLTIPEMFRIAHAFHGGSRFAEGSDVFVVMSRTAPLHRIQGLYGSREEAESAMREPEAGWSEEELAGRGIFPVKAPPHTHEWAGKIAGPRSVEIESLELRVKVKQGRTWKYDLPLATDMITLTPAAYHVFLYSYYLDHFGKQYAEERLRLVSGRQIEAGDSEPQPMMKKSMRADTGSSATDVSGSPYRTVIAHNDWTEDVTVQGQVAV